MQSQQAKPRIKYADMISNRITGKPTVADVIERYIAAMNGTSGLPPIKPLGESHLCTLRVIQRGELGPKVAESLTKADIIGYCERLKATRMASTVQQYMVFLRGVLNFAGSRWDDCSEVSAAVIDTAKPLLQKYGMVGKSVPRKRLPTADEISRLMEYLGAQDAGCRAKIKMVPVVAFGLVSARRRGEVCRIVHGDVDYEKKVYWVRDLKHPKMKKGNDRCFVLWPELEQIIRMQPRLTDDPKERIFPYNPKSVTKRYIDSKKALGIENLRLHDNRGEATSKWLLKLGSRDKVRKLVTGHDSEKAFDVYDRRSTEDIMRADEVVQKYMTPAAATV